MATVLAELNIVAVSSASGLKNKYQLMLTSIKTSHSAVVFYPDTNVFQFGIDFISGLHHFAGVTPIHAYEIDRTGLAKSLELKTNPRQEVRKIRATHLAASHGEFAVLCPA